MTNRILDISYKSIIFLLSICLFNLGLCSNFEKEPSGHLSRSSLPSFPSFDAEVCHRSSALYLIQNHQRSHFSHILDQMHQRRYDVFHKRLQWDVPVCDGRESDQYDLPEAIYVVYHDQTHGVCGGIRFLPTTGPYMLKNTFSHLVANKELIPNSPDIWEISRLFFCRPKYGDDSLGFTRKGTAELFISMQEFGLSWNLKKFVAVTDLRVEKILNRLGWPTLRLAQPQVHQEEPVLVLEMAVGEDILIDMRKKANIHYPVTTLMLPFSPIKAAGFPVIDEYNKRRAKL